MTTQTTTYTVDDVKSRLDIVTYIAQHVALKKQGTAYKARCPFHDDHTPSFAVSQAKQSWHCFGSCNEGGDVITFIMKFHKMDFRAALEEAARCAGMSGSQIKRPVSPAVNTPRIDDAAQPPNRIWQQHSSIVVHRAVKTLWETERGRDALDYLLVTRGLSRNTIRAAQIGFVPAKDDIELKYGKVVDPEWLKDDGKPYRVPCGITIPHYADNQLWAVRVRTINGSPKYSGIPGGTKALYWSDHIEPGYPVLITEGELDALVVWEAAQAYWMNVFPVSIASAANKTINQRWWSKLAGAPTLLVRVDRDDAGQKALAALTEFSSSVKGIQIPGTEKDINDWYLSHDHMAIVKWLESECA